jgi:hypothetical protein
MTMMKTVSSCVEGVIVLLGVLFCAGDSIVQLIAAPATGVLCFVRRGTRHFSQTGFLLDCIWHTITQ